MICAHDWLAAALEPDVRLTPAAMSISLRKGAVATCSSPCTSLRAQVSSTQLERPEGHKDRKDIMGNVARRTFLKLSGGAAASVSGGLAAILATGRAPAYAQQTTIHWLRWNDFVPASDQLLRNQQSCAEIISFSANQSCLPMSVPMSGMFVSAPPERASRRRTHTRVLREEAHGRKGICGGKICRWKRARHAWDRCSSSSARPRRNHCPLLGVKNDPQDTPPRARTCTCGKLRR